MMILGYGEKVKVLSPEALIRRIDDRIRAMAYLYTQTNDNAGES